MKYYKVLKNDRGVDVLDHLVFCKYQKKHGIMVLCTEEDAQAILSSDGKYIWHIPQLYKIPVDGYDPVELQEIDRYEYDRMKLLGLKTPEEIIDAYTMSLIDGGVL